VKTVLITGASSGIGRASLDRMHQSGWHVVAGVLPTEDVSDLQAQYSDRLTILPMDITDVEQIANGRQQIEALVGDRGLDGLVNNAGIGISAPIELQPMANIRQVMEVNYFGHVQVTRAMLPLIRQSKGRIVNIASVLGLVGLPLLGAYAASKFAIVGLSETLRNELKPQGIHVAMIAPGYIQTPIWDVGLSDSRNMREEFPEQALKPYQSVVDAMENETDTTLGDASPPDVVAAAVAHALNAAYPKARYAVGHQSSLYAFLSRLPARLRDWLIDRNLY
jgi:NAD(P)-dependent dehydrogenase (short-subunit alcohol dehydrogenase family)